MSGEYITSENPSGVLADAFFQKGHSTIAELFQEVTKLLAASPIRSEGEKTDIAPLFVPRDNAGYHRSPPKLPVETLGPVKQRLALPILVQGSTSSHTTVVIPLDERIIFSETTHPKPC